MAVVPLFGDSENPTTLGERQRLRRGPKRCGVFPGPPHSQEAHERGLGGMDLTGMDRANAERSDGKTAMAFGG